MYLLKYAEVFYFVPMPNHPPTSKVFIQSYRFVYLAVDSIDNSNTNSKNVGMSIFCLAVSSIRTVGVLGNKKNREQNHNIEVAKAGFF